MDKDGPTEADAIGARAKVFEYILRNIAATIDITPFIANIVEALDQNDVLISSTAGKTGLEIAKALMVAHLMREAIDGLSASIAGDRAGKPPA